MFRESAIAAAVVVAAIACLTSCVTPRPVAQTSRSDDPYAVELSEARANAVSDLEQDVLADLAITHAEYEEAAAQYAACLTESGFPTVTIDLDGFFSYDVTGRAEGDEWDSANDHCRPGTVGVIEPLYVEMTRNPTNVPIAELIVTCLIKNELVDPTFTSTELEDYATAPAESESAPWDEEDPRVEQCFREPSG